MNDELEMIWNDVIVRGLLVTSPSHLRRKLC
jgi:hypothetical protein